jgi:holo-[acyl-carrier protein] synthase
VIITTGIDIIQISRIKKLYQKFGYNLAAKVLSTKELQKFNEHKIAMQNESERFCVSFIAKSFAAKEAFVKALGCGFNGIHLRDISILRNINGKPFIELSSTGKTRAIEALQNSAPMYINLLQDSNYQESIIEQNTDNNVPLHMLNYDISISDEMDYCVASVVIYL